MRSIDRCVVVVGVAGAEYSHRGFIEGYDPETGKHLWRNYNIPGKGDSAPMPGGVVIDVDPALSADYRHVSVSTTGSPTRSETTIGGERFEVVGDILHIGSRRYGPLKPGNRVRVDKEGVHIDGKLVAALP